MEEDQYIEQERNIRPGVHFHDGVWWKRTSPQCCEPLYVLQDFAQGTSRPARFHSMVGYSHLVSDRDTGSCEWACQFLDGENFEKFSFGNLRREKQKAIRRAEKSGLDIERISDIEEHWKDLKEIYISSAIKTKFGLSPDYYEKNEAAWQEGLRREFALGGRDWYGVFFEGKLICFLYSCLIGDTAYLLVTKAIDSLRQMQPGVYVHFHVISMYRGNPKCKRIFAGRSIGISPTVDEFKERLGFRIRMMPAYQIKNQMLYNVGVFAVRMVRPLVRMMPGKGFQTLRQRIENLYLHVSGNEIDK